MSTIILCCCTAVLSFFAGCVYVGILAERAARRRKVRL